MLKSDENGEKWSPFESNIIKIKEIHIDDHKIEDNIVEYNQINVTNLNLVIIFGKFKKLTPFNN